MVYGASGVLTGNGREHRPAGFGALHCRSLAHSSSSKSPIHMEETEVEIGTEGALRAGPRWP